MDWETITADPNRAVGGVDEVARGATETAVYTPVLREQRRLLRSVTARLGLGLPTTKHPTARTVSQPARNEARSLALLFEQLLVVGGGE